MAEFFSRVSKPFRSLGRLEAAFIGMVLVTFVVRLVGVGDKPLHHDESLHAWFSWRLEDGQGYHYDPVYHGPVQFLLMAFSYVIFGVSDFTARIAPVAVGSLMVGIPYFLRRRIGVPATIFASLLLMISPSFFYFSRFAREDIYFACITLGLVAALLAFLDQPKKWHPTVMLVLLALAFATKEATFITAFLIGVFLVALFLIQVRRTSWSDTKLVRSIKAPGLDYWVWGVGAFLLVFATLFTVFFTNLAGMEEGLIGGIRYWLSQHSVRRGDQPWFFYLVLLGGYEWPIVGLGIVGGVIAIRERKPTGVFLVWFAVGSLVVYSWAGERMPWLVIHPLLPMVILAAIALGKMWERRKLLVTRFGFALITIGAGYLVYSAINISYFRPASPKELLVYTQSDTDVLQVRDEIERLNEEVLAAKGRPLRVVVDSSLGATWPWAWYLRELPQTAYLELLSNTFDPDDFDAVLILDQDRPRFQQLLTDFEGRPYQHRVWWTPDYAAADPGDFLEWVSKREPWNELGSLDAWLYVRKTLPGAERLARSGP